MSRERRKFGCFRYDEIPAWKRREVFERLDPLSSNFRPRSKRSRPSDIVDGNPVLEPRSSLLESRAAITEKSVSGIERRFFSELS